MKKECQHNETHFINGTANWFEIDYNICVCIECGKTLFQIKEDNSGELWQTEKYIDENGYKLFKFVKVVNDNIWTEITTKAGMGYAIELPILRKILEKFQILNDEKDGM